MLKLVLAGVLVLALLFWLRRPQSAVRPALPPPFTPQPGVVLGAAEIPAEDARVRRFALTYDANARTARFRFSYTPKAPTGESPFVITRGTLESDTSSDNTSLLAALAEVHGGNPPTGQPLRVGRLDLDVGVLGERLARQPGSNVIAGEFTDHVSGPWLVTKLFLPGTDPDEEQPEVFLVIAPAAGRAEFLVKDQGHWPALGERLAAVL